MAPRGRPGSEALVRAVMIACCLTRGASFGIGLRAVARTPLSRLIRTRGVHAAPRALLRTGCRREDQAGLTFMSTEAESPVVSAGVQSGAEVATSKQSSVKVPVKKRIVSGVQPTGNLHFGNYLGAIKQWVDNQDKYENFFFVVDLHAITVPQDPKQLKAGVITAAATYLAAGIDPEKSKVFVQSHVKAHTELTWLLTCATPINWLERMIQFKEKKSKQGENVGSGLLTYPVLMASDILLYRPDLVPVGEDQRQHLELTRDLARRFNDQFCKRKRNTFKDPQALIVKEGARVMSLTDGTSKMSKSDPVEGSRINLTDSPDVIAKKLRKCKTDMYQGLEWDNPDRPECTNLLTIYQIRVNALPVRIDPGLILPANLLWTVFGAVIDAEKTYNQAVTGKSREEVSLEVQDMSWGTFKPLLADATVEHLRPLQTRYKDILEDRSYLNKVLRDGAEAADEVASETLGWAKEAMGISSLKDFQ